MPLRFVCPLCWAVRDGVDDALMGKRIKCNDCHAMSVATHTPAPNIARTMISKEPVRTLMESMPQAVPVPEPQSMPSPYPTPVLEQARKVLCSTGDIRLRYEIVDLVFAHGSSAEGALRGKQAGEAFPIVVQWLEQAALRRGADAVVHVHVDFRPASDGQAFDVYAYGTAVKLAERDVND